MYICYQVQQTLCYDFQTLPNINYFLSKCYFRVMLESELKKIKILDVFTSLHPGNNLLCYGYLFQYTFKNMANKWPVLLHNELIFVVKPINYGYILSYPICWQMGYCGTSNYFAVRGLP